jgi:hypothetical protein
MSGQLTAGFLPARPLSNIEEKKMGLADRVSEHFAEMQQHVERVSETPAAQTEFGSLQTQLSFGLIAIEGAFTDIVKEIEKLRLRDED